MNNSKTTSILLCALLAGAGLLSPAAAAEAEPQPNPQPRIEKRVVLMHGDGMPFAGPMARMRGKVVKNAPYSAEAVTERQQNLADGNQIVNKTSSMSYRDSAGRTRQEVLDNNGEVRLITIHDAADGSTYLLRPKDKSATKIAALGKDVERAAHQGAMARIEQLRKEGKLPAAGARGEREHIVINRVEQPDGELRKQIQVRVESALNGVGRLPGMDAFAGAFGDMKWAAKATTRELGVREFEGVKAEGKLRSYEIPAGEVGNRNPITVADENWFSPELQVTVYSKHSDPRSGDSTYRLTNLKREEPAAALFAVPADYTVKDAMTEVKRRLIEKK